MPVACGAACVGNVTEVNEAWKVDGGPPAKLVVVEGELDREGTRALDEHRKGDGEPRAGPCGQGIIRCPARSRQLTAGRPCLRGRLQAAHWQDSRDAAERHTGRRLVRDLHAQLQRVTDLRWALAAGLTQGNGACRRGWGGGSA